MSVDANCSPDGSARGSVTVYSAQLFKGTGVLRAAVLMGVLCSGAAPATDRTRKTVDVKGGKQSIATVRADALAAVVQVVAHEDGGKQVVLESQVGATLQAGTRVKVPVPELGAGCTFLFAFKDTTLSLEAAGCTPSKVEFLVTSW